MAKQSDKIAVIGGGSWATALVKMLCNNLENVNWWMRGQDSVDYIHKYKRNPKYLQSVEFDLNKISAITSKENIPSQKLIKKLGLQYKSIVRLPGDDNDLLYFELKNLNKY